MPFLISDVASDRRVRHVAGAFFMSFGAMSCSTDTPAAPEPQFPRTFLDVRYAPTLPAQRLDLYLPDTGAGPFPLVLWIHGGGWTAGSKALDITAP